MTSLVISEVRKRLQKFSIDHINDTDEKQHAQQFWRDFYFCFGLTHSSASMFEARVVKISGKKGYIDSFIPSLLIVEHKSFGEDLQKAYEQAQEYFHAIKNEFDKPKYIIVSDFKSFHLYDIRKDSKTPHICSLDKLDEHADWFMFLAEKDVEEIIEETPVNRKATFQISKLHDQLLKNNYIGRDLEVFLTRLVFCLFAEDTGLFGEDNQFSKLIEHTNEDGSDTGQTINLLFQVLNTPHNERQTNLDDLFKKFEYVNGSLFEEQIKIPFFDSELRQILFDCTRLDWSDISPAIFGSMFQAVLEKGKDTSDRKESRRELGAHYTSERNILKVIQSLFLNDLIKEFEDARLNKQTNRLIALYEKLPLLKFFDPACGCGNFLIVTYKELRNLENSIVEELFFKGQQGGLLDISTLCKVNISQFYGIEIDTAASNIAKVALYITDHQENLKSARKFGSTRPSVPLINTPHIHNENALFFGWENVISNMECTYIFGNPPFIGKQYQTDEQKKDMEIVAGEIKNFGLLDYVSSWYIKACRYIQNTKIEVAFVSTNSITQGEQVSVLWKWLLDSGININFAHRAFKWSNEGKGVAGVHCVIIGFSLIDRKNKVIYSYENTSLYEPTLRNASRINPYLVDAANIVLENRKKPICKVPNILFGSMPNDGGNLLLSDEEKNLFLKEYPESEKWIRPFVGADEFINNIKKWCLWLKGISPTEIKSIQPIYERISKVKKLREESKRESTKSLAATPYLFGEIRQPENGNYLLIPGVSSEKRNYIPIGFLDSSVIASNASLIIPNATLYHFSILNSNLHNAWMRYTCGRLESRYRYSNSIVYNNFIWPDHLSNENIIELEACAEAILDARSLYPNSSLADLYDPISMPNELVKAHQLNNKMVNKVYKFSGEDSDVSYVEFLFDLYEKVTAQKID